MNLYSKNSAGDHQGLLIDETTGRTVALAYDTNDTAELARRWNAFEPDGEVARLRKELNEFVSRWSYSKPPTGAELEIYLDAARAALAQSGGAA